MTDLTKKINKRKNESLHQTLGIKSIQLFDPIHTGETTSIYFGSSNSNTNSTTLIPGYNQLEESLENIDYDKRSVIPICEPYNKDEKDRYYLVTVEEKLITTLKDYQIFNIIEVKEKTNFFRKLLQSFLELFSHNTTNIETILRGLNKNCEIKHFSYHSTKEDKHLSCVEAIKTSDNNTPLEKLFEPKGFISTFLSIFKNSSLQQSSKQKDTRSQVHKNTLKRVEAHTLNPKKNKAAPTNNNKSKNTEFPSRNNGFKGGK